MCSLLWQGELEPTHGSQNSDHVDSLLYPHILGPWFEAVYFNLISIFIIFTYFGGTHIKTREALVGVCPLPLACGFQGSRPDPQAW